MTRGGGWWWATGVVWAVLPSILGIVELYLPTAVAVGGASGIGLAQYLWAIPGIVAALVTGVDGRRRILSAVLVLLGAAACHLLPIFVVPAIAGAAAGGGVGVVIMVSIGLGALLAAIAVAAMVLGRLVAMRDRPRVLWTLPIAFALFGVAYWSVLVEGTLSWLSGSLQLVAGLLTVVIWVGLARPSREAAEEPADTP